MIAALLLAAAAAPSPEAEALGRRLAERGTLATIAPLQMKKEIEELIAEHPELSEAEQGSLRSSAQRTAETLRAQVIAAEGEAYARHLALADLRILVHQAESPARRRMQAALVPVTVDTMKALGEVDFKGSVKRDFCRATGKLCGAPRPPQ